MDYGRSVAMNEPRSADDFVVWLDELFDGLGLENGLGLGGFSHADWIISRYALARPDRPRRVVLIAPAATALPLRAKFSVRAMATMLPLRWGTKQLVNWLLGDVLKKRSEYKALVDRSVDGPFLASRSYKLQKPTVQPDVLSDAELLRLSETPTLFLVGEMEVIYSADEALHRIRKVAPAICLEVVPEAGHPVTETRPAELNERLLAFLK